MPTGDRAGVVASAYVEWKAPPALDPLVACLWRRVVPAGQPLTLVLPDGCVDLIWESGRGAYLAGPDTGPMPATLLPGQVLVGVRLRPGAGGPLLGVPLTDLLNLRVDAADWDPAVAHQLPGSLPANEAFRRLVRTVGRLTEKRPADGAVVHAARLLADPATRISHLGSLLDLSERQVRRQFQTAVGYGPKTLQRVLRFHRFVSRLNAPGAGRIAELAFETGYADHAHLCRETTRLAGMTPAALARTLTSTTPGPPDPSRQPASAPCRAAALRSAAEPAWPASAAGVADRLELDLAPRGHGWAGNRSVEFFSRHLRRP